MMEEMISRQVSRMSMSLPLRVCLSEHSANPVSSDWHMNPEAEFTLTENFSSRGCYFSLSRKPPLGTRLEMEITIPGTFPDAPFARIFCRGRVIRVDRDWCSPDCRDARFGVAATIEMAEDVYAESVRKPTRRAALAVSA